ncbi:PHP domain-like protein [Hypoxylon rubiginosum]|uniref:PHP domain-like protein n=1 Tax=Hypoxylon rubiginosum TaxID=110542 RepID=A0ACC0D9P8_9PEZI|nr:PHP domain-like protein [Hypoxylon rubiginosum]
MLYDLNIPWSPSTSTADLELILRLSAQLGYNVVALNHSLQAPLPFKIENPLPKLPLQAPTTSTTKDAAPPRIPTVLHRATVSFSDPSQNQQLRKAAMAYDILAMRPQTEKAFQAACLTVEEASIISLDMTARLPFNLRPKSCMAAIERGLHFEIGYGQAIAPDADARARAHFAGNVAQLVRATRGRGIIVSSEAAPAMAMALRPPADVLNLLAVWGLSPERGREALGSNPRAVVANEGIKRRGFRGVVDIVSVADRPEGEKRPDENDGQATESTTIGKKDNKKRKNGEGNSTGGGTGEGQPLSKRQAKKLKLAALREKAEEKGSRS